MLISPSLSPLLPSRHTNEYAIYTNINDLFSSNFSAIQLLGVGVINISHTDIVWQRASHIISVPGTCIANGNKLLHCFAGHC